MLEQARRNMNTSDKIRVLDENTGALIFENITKEDITAKGRIVPIGARHFAEQAKRLQEINQLIITKTQDPTIGVHLSGKRIAQLITEELGEPSLFEENVQVSEQMDTQRFAQEAQVQLQNEQQIAAEQGL
jgi:hypothetical protein